MKSPLRKNRPPADFSEPHKPWTVTFTAWLDDGTKVLWDYECTWQCDDHNRGARGLAQMQKYTTCGVTADDVLYPAHRISKITWETT